MSSRPTVVHAGRLHSEMRGPMASEYHNKGESFKSTGARREAMLAQINNKPEALLDYQEFGDDPVTIAAWIKPGLAWYVPVIMKHVIGKVGASTTPVARLPPGAVMVSAEDVQSIAANVVLTLSGKDKMLHCLGARIVPGGPPVDMHRSVKMLTMLSKVVFKGAAPDLAEQKLERGAELGAMMDQDLYTVLKCGHLTIGSVAESAELSKEVMGLLLNLTRALTAAEHSREMESPEFARDHERIADLVELYLTTGVPRLESGKASLGFRMWAVVLVAYVAVLRSVMPATGDGRKRVVERVTILLTDLVKRGVFANAAEAKGKVDKIVTSIADDAAARRSRFSPAEQEIREVGMRFENAERDKEIKWEKNRGDRVQTAEEVDAVFARRREIRAAAEAARRRDDCARRDVRRDPAERAVVPAAAAPADELEQPVSPRRTKQAVGRAFDPTPADRVHSRQRLLDVVVNAGRVLLHRVRVRDRLRRAEEMREGRAKRAEADALLSSCEVIYATVPVPARSVVREGDAARAIEPASAEREFADPIPLKEPFAFRRKGYQPHPFPEHPFLNSDPPVPVSDYAPGTDAVAELVDEEQRKKWDVSDFQEPVPTFGAHFPTEGFCFTPPLPHVFFPYDMKQQETDAGAPTPYRDYTFMRDVPPCTVNDTYRTRTALNPELAPPLMTRPIHDDRMSDTEDETAAALPSMHPRGLRDAAAWLRDMARVKFSKVEVNQHIVMTPENCVVDRVYYTGVITRKDSGGCTVHWSDPTQGGPPAHFAIPKERIERRGWWDGDGWVRFADAAPGMQVSMMPEGAPERAFYCGVVTRKEADTVTIRWKEPQDGGPPAKMNLSMKERPERREWWDGDGRMKFADAAVGAAVTMTPEGTVPEQFYSCVVLRKDADSVAVKWNEPQDGGPPARLGLKESTYKKEWWDGYGRPRPQGVTDWLSTLPCVCEDGDDEVPGAAYTIRPVNSHDAQVVNPLVDANLGRFEASENRMREKLPPRLRKLF